MERRLTKRINVSRIRDEDFVFPIAVATGPAMERRTASPDRRMMQDIAPGGANAQFIHPKVMGHVNSVPFAGMRQASGDRNLKSSQHSDFAAKQHADRHIVTKEHLQDMRNAHFVVGTPEPELARSTSQLDFVTRPITRNSQLENANKEINKRVSVPVSQDRNFSRDSDAYANHGRVSRERPVNNNANKTRSDISFSSSVDPERYQTSYKSVFGKAHQKQPCQCSADAKRAMPERPKSPPLNYSSPINAISLSKTVY
jgi:hypothetical protein